ncbi:MAG: hypothetical protein KatS3mg068_2461 [Candidatus Sericytochromatia bacterium]|nr:MAG: hypothetical protein KatS3mg068_2461 [Candidatus Sericytochromatia bacterium]
MKKKYGFTLIEAMMAVVILGIIISLSIGQFNEAQIRAKYASLKNNMRNLQTMVETYSINNGGICPGKADALRTEALEKNYWKPFKNPFLGQNDPVKDVEDITSINDLEPGEVLYGGADSNATFIDIFNNSFNDRGSYVIYAVDRVKGALTHNGRIYYVSNN